MANQHETVGGNLSPEVQGLERKLDEARKELLETSTRSRLLHTPLGSSRAKIVEIQEELSEQVFRMLVRDSKAMSFLASRERIETTLPDLALSQPDDSIADDLSPAAHHIDTKLQTTLSSEKLQTRLRSIAYDAQLIESEQGVNVLYLALGFLTWYEARDPEKPRHAPLILIPTTLTRESAGERFSLRYSGEELGTNLSLQQRLREDGLVLPDLPDADDLSPNEYLSQVAECIQGIPKWTVQRDAVVLGFFSFAKLMMYRDLDPDLWPLQDGLRNHPIIGGLLTDGFRGENETLISEDAPVDPLIDISTVGHVVDADSSQMLAIEDVRSGANLIIQGPPGTGKSQTITNLIAAAVRDGKRVLFVAEKMAALNVVRENLARVGLAQICLELHSHKAKKRVVLSDLEQTYDLSPLGVPTKGNPADSLRARRNALNEYVQNLHAPLEPSARTPFDAFGRLARLDGTGVTPPDFQLDAAKAWHRAEMEERMQVVKRLAAHVGVMGVPGSHPWRGVGIDVVLPQDAKRWAARAGELYTSLSELIETATALEATSGISCATLEEGGKLVRLGAILGRAPSMDPKSMDNDEWLAHRAEVVELVTRGATYSKARARLHDVLIPEAWDAEVSEIRKAFAEYGESWFRWLRKEYRAAVRRYKSLHLPSRIEDLAHRFEILNVLITGQQARAFVRAHDALGKSAFGSKWGGENSDWTLLEAIVEWEKEASGTDLPRTWRRQIATIRNWPAFAADCARAGKATEEMSTRMDALFAELRFDVQEAFGTDAITGVLLSTLRDRVGGFATQPERLQQWCTWRIWSREAHTLELAEIVDRLGDGRIEASETPEIFEYACYESLARQAFALHRNLAVFDGRSHEAIVAEFQRLDRERLAFSRQEVAARHLQMIPAGGHNVGEIGILAREWEKQRRHLPLRQLVKAAGRAMQQIKPVWMMSPMSLAQFVAPGALTFDLVIMDEASQIRPVEALGAVARARQVVVVGDEKQLPPTSFFDRVAFEDSEPPDAEEFQAADVESILGLCSAQGIPDRMLRWHYRSQHESLIAVSNLEFYKKLFIVPSAHSDDLGLRFKKVNGVYDRGRTATNHVEAQVIATAVIEHARRYGHCARYPEGMSLCVGTFSVAQRDCVLDELEILRRQHPELEPFFDSKEPESFFVKNLESIQGDERDVVFISVGYGPDENGYQSMGFGPIASAGGERRLNVLISRARRRCEVFSSITAADIDLQRATSVGARVLKTFLNYAETGHLDRADAGTGRPIDSDFEEDVGSALAGAGYQIEHQVGVAGFFVDLAVRNPERPGSYWVGIECDGAAYHSARSARDRDRLREEILETRGWRIHRIWSTDWFNRRQGELQRTIAAIEAARLLGVFVPEQRSNAAAPKRGTSTRQENLARSEPLPVVGQTVHSTKYTEATFREHVSVEPHVLPMDQRVSILARIVEIEGPIHETEVARRYATVCGKDRSGTRIQEATRMGLSRAVNQGKLHRDGFFYMIAPMKECAPRDRASVDSVTVRKAEMLPPIEIRTGLTRIVADHIGVEPSAAIVEVARMFGFEHTGQDLKRVIEDQLRQMLGAGFLVLKNGNRLYVSPSA